jgi:hypothetical protein
MGAGSEGVWAIVSSASLEEAKAEECCREVNGVIADIKVLCGGEEVQATNMGE